MALHQEITDLRKSGRLDEAYSLAKQSLAQHPDDKFIKSAYGWVIYEKLKKTVEMATQNNLTQKDALSVLKDLLGQ